MSFAGRVTRVRARRRAVRAREPHTWRGGASEGRRRPALAYLHAEMLRERRGGRLFDPRRPTALIFARQPGRHAMLVGVMYSVQRGEHGPSPGGPITRWHSHVVCSVGSKRGSRLQQDGRCAPGASALQGSEMMHVWFTRDLRSAFAIGAPQPELCRDGLLSGAFYRSPGAHRAM